MAPSYPLPDLTDKTFVITGANSGIGYEAARALARKHATIVMACRNLEKANAAKARILAETPNARLEVQALNLGDLASVRDFAAVMREREKLHVLINNAGVMAIPRQLSVDGFETQLAVNHLGHFALTGLLLDRLLATPGSRIVNVSSKVSFIGRMAWDDLDRAKNYHPWAAYAQSKLAILLFTFELARRLSELRLDVRSVACHPGYAATNLQFVGPEQYGSKFGHLVMTLGNRLFAQSAEAGALPTLFASVDPDAQSGDFIAPQGFAGRGQPGKEQGPHRAYDAASMQKLWEVSVERTSVDYAALAPPGSRPASGRAAQA